MVGTPVSPEAASSVAAGDRPMLSMKGISKSFPGVLALSNADFDVRPGEIHGLVGKNGAGKSTLVGVLMGIQQPDAGTIEINGVPLRHGSPQDVLDAGIAYVPQQIRMLNTLTVAENILAGHLPKNRFGLVDWKEVYSDSERRLNTLGLKLDVRLRVEGLSVADKTMLAIAKALFSHARLIILDEPTAVLGRNDTNLLFNLVRSLRDQGVSFIYISHHLEEIFEICNRVTVMRDGQVIGTKDVSAITTPELIQMMVGETVGEYLRSPTSQDQEAFHVEGLTRRGHYENINLTLKRGEVVGLCGLQSSGVGELSRALFGMERRGMGQVRIGGKPLTARTPKEAFKQGIAYLPDDRHRFGLVGLRSVRENVTYSILDSLTKLLGVVPQRDEMDLVSSYVDKLGIVTPTQERRVQLLSGGNQQKVVFARLAATKPTVLILHEPTQGVDVRAKVDIFNIISDLSSQGVAILIVSTEVRELIGLCDRILVMYQGQITREFDRAQGEYRPDKILIAIEGGK